MGAVLVHIDLDGERPDRPDPSSLTALAAGRAIASSWGATLYAAIAVHDPSERGHADSTGRITTASRLAIVEAVQRQLAAAGADKVVVAVTATPVTPLWSSIGAAWQAVLDHLRPRLVLFGADAPSAAELGPRTGARIGARLLLRARAVPGDLVELRDRDGGYVRASDGGAAVVLVGAAPPALGGGDDLDVDLLVLAISGDPDPRIELLDREPADPQRPSGVAIAIGDELAGDPELARGAARLAHALGGQLLGSAAAARLGAFATTGEAAGAVVERGAPLAPELCIAIGAPAIDL
ncbi:MAG: hypothetical protein ACTHU0_35665, partial [Kofleriaceae bacterium]